MTDQTLATRAEQAVETKPADANPMAMLSQAVASGASIEVLTKLMDLQERWEANQARKAFTTAFASFKAEAVTIVRNKLVTDGPLRGKSYAELTSFVEAVTPALSKHELTASWDITKDDKDWIEVTCIIEHVLGGSKRVSLGGPPDAGGAKNAIQARASTVTYLERHTLKAACGLAEQGDDKDGNGDVRAINDAQRQELDALIASTGADLDKFLGFFNIDFLAELPAPKYQQALVMLKQKQKVGANA